MAYDGGSGGDIKVFNPSRELAIEITLDIMKAHRDAFKQARTGEIQGVNPYELSDKQRKLNQVQALGKIISWQREMIKEARGKVKNTEYEKWRKKNDTEELRRENPFEKEDNDYTTLLFLRDFLIYCFNSIEIAEETRDIKDDFLIIRHNNSGEYYKLTDNFKEMLNELENTYETINSILHKHEIISAGLEENNKETYEELEKEAMNRVREG